MATKKDALGIGHMDVLGFDPGNAYVKWVDAYGNVKRMPSYIGEIPDGNQYLEELDKPDSVVITYEGVHYVIGERAKQLNFPPMFKEGKENKAHLMVLAVVAQSGFNNSHPTVGNLRVLVENNRANGWAFLRELLNGQVIRYHYRGESVSARIDKVTLVPEGIPPYLWAVSKEQFKRPSRSQGVIDFGGGAMTARLISPQGQINWKLSIHKKGINDLARSIAYRIQQKHGLSESLDEDVIMSSMEDGLKSRKGIASQDGTANPFRYTYGGTDYEYEDIYEEERVKWFTDLGKYLLTQLWFGEQLGEVLLVGGGAYHAELMETMTKGRFFIPKDSKYPNDFAQSINAYVLSNPGT